MPTSTVWSSVWFAICFNMLNFPHNSFRTATNMKAASHNPSFGSTSTTIYPVQASMHAVCGGHIFLLQAWSVSEGTSGHVAQKTCNSHSCWRAKGQSGVTAGHKFMKWEKVAAEMNYHENYCFSSFCISCTINSAEVCEGADCGS